MLEIHCFFRVCIFALLKKHQQFPGLVVQRRNSCLELEVLSFDEVESVTQLDDAQLLALEILRTKATLINPKYTPARSDLKTHVLLLPTCTVQAN